MVRRAARSFNEKMDILQLARAWRLGNMQRQQLPEQAASGLD